MAELTELEIAREDPAFMHSTVSVAGSQVCVSSGISVVIGVGSDSKAEVLAAYLDAAKTQMRYVALKIDELIAEGKL